MLKEEYKRKHDISDPFKDMYDRIMNPEERRKSRVRIKRKEELEDKKKDLGLKFN